METEVPGSPEVSVPEEVNIHAPSYYTGGNIETWDFIIDKGMGFLLGNVVKYIVRAGSKPGNSRLLDLQKARVYLDKEIKREQGLEKVLEQVPVDAPGRMDSPSTRIEGL